MIDACQSSTGSWLAIIVDDNWLRSSMISRMSRLSHRTQRCRSPVVRIGKRILESLASILGYRSVSTGNGRSDRGGAALCSIRALNPWRQAEGPGCRL